MTNNHGETPLDVATDWSTVGKKASNKQAALNHSGQTSKKSNQNHQAIGEIENIITTDPSPVERNESTILTRVNFKVIPNRDIKTISVSHSICRIVAAIKASDKNARIIATNEEENEIEFHGAKDLKGNNEASQDHVKQFIQEPRMNKSNHLVGLIILRSEMEFKDIKKHHATQKGLNDNPRIFLSVNQLDVVTPTAVGFFINTTPRPDKPETFTNRFNEFLQQHDENIKIQIEFGPIWAPNNRVSVPKLMAAFDDKEQLRRILSHYQAGPNDDTYVCMTEFSSLPDAQKIKMIRCQAEYSMNIRSLFIDGFKSIQGEMGPGNEAKSARLSVGHWIFNRETSYGNRMFTRVYSAVNGVVELHVKKENIKEATDWARLATSEIASELNDHSMIEVFINPHEAMESIGDNPEWKPHSLGAKIDKLAEPTATTIPRQRREQVNMDYAKTNEKRNNNAAKTSNKNKGATKQDNRRKADEKIATTAATVSKNYVVAPKFACNSKKAADSDDEDMELEPMTDDTSKPKAGINKYKQAAAANEQRIGKLEEQMVKIMTNQKDANSNIDKLVAGHKTSANNIDKLIVATAANKRDADRKYEESGRIMFEFQSSMKNIEQMLGCMKSSNRDEEVHFSSTMNTGQEGPNADWDSSIEYDESNNNPEASHLKTNYSSDAVMDGAADEK